jgi:signal transduction histidine kinase
VFSDQHVVYGETRKTRLIDSAGKRYVLGITVDQTKARQREVHSQTITNAMPVGVIEISEARGVIFVNELALAYLGLKDSAAELGKVLPALNIGETGFPGDKHKFEVTVGSEATGRRRVLVQSSGWLSIPYSSERTAIVSLTDLSEVFELRRENDEVTRLNLELEDKISQLKLMQSELVRRGQLEQLGQLTATIAHELRNPLGAVRTSAFLLQRKLQANNPGTEKQFERVSNGITRCDEIITQLLDFARVRKLELKDVALDSWLAQLVEEECRALPSEISVVCELGLDNTIVACDASRLSRAVSNIISNAAEAMVGKDLHKVSNATVNPTITISTKQTARGTEIEISDNGPGMSAEIIARVREPLFTTKNFGTGLGVPAVEKILQNHNGGLNIWSEVGVGSRFTLWWPLTVAEEEAA